LHEVSTGNYRDAELHERVDSASALKAQDSWLTYIALARAAAASAGTVLPKLPHEHWQWFEKVKLTERLLPYPTLGIECDGQMQGLMLLETDGHFARLSPGGRAPLVYVTLVATAPWNLTDVTREPRFQGVGLTLLAAAMELSLDLGFKGRVGLHSLPTSEWWYDKYGITCCGPDNNKQDLKYYEVTPEFARDFLA
jgi:hypothetical protein